MSASILTRRVRHLRTRVAVATVAVLVAAAAGAAFARPRTTSIGKGVVVIDTKLAYQGGEAAGTGMVLTSSGEILTNNHVIRDATSIKVVVPGTGRRYAATVVGYDRSADVAVLQLTGASNLRTVTLGDSSSVKVGQSVTAFGNAGGTGRLTSSSGKVVATHRSITVGDEEGGSEHLTRLIETDAKLQPGDSGGPLATAAGKVIAMDAAVSVSDGNGFQQAAAGDGYAIPINRALAIARQIERGSSSASVHVGGTAFLGVELAPAQAAGPFGPAASGALIEGILPGGAAATAGLADGDVITAVNGRAITSPTALSSLLSTHKPGDDVSIGYTDPTGVGHTTTVTLASGPPQ